MIHYILVVKDKYNKAVFVTYTSSTRKFLRDSIIRCLENYETEDEHQNNETQNNEGYIKHIAKRGKVFKVEKVDQIDSRECTPEDISAFRRKARQLTKSYYEKGHPIKNSRYTTELKKIKCPCGSIFTRRKKCEHERTLKHQRWLREQENSENSENSEN